MTSLPALDDAVSHSTAWQSTCEGLLRGVLHDFGNSVASFHAFAEMLRMGESFEGAVRREYERELARTGALLAEAWLLPRRGEPRAEPLSVAAVLPPLLRLQARHRELAGVRYVLEPSPEPPPVMMDATLLAHALLVLLTLAGMAVSREAGVAGRPPTTGAGAACGGAGQVRVRAEEGGGGTGLTLVRVEWAGSPCEPPAALADGVPAARRTIESAGGVLREATSGSRTELSAGLPALR